MVYIVELVRSTRMYNRATAICIRSAVYACSLMNTHTLESRPLTSYRGSGLGLEGVAVAPALVLSASAHNKTKRDKHKIERK